MDKHYTVEKHTQILIALMKFHGIRKVVASPGSTNICLVGSLQQDPFFEIYSCVDERSAAFIACGLAAESGEPIAISCTGSTASRNYIPGLTEAYYRHLPVLAITSSQHLGRAGNLMPQFIDRSQPLADIVKESVTVDCVYTEEDEWACELNVNRALLALTANGGGPAHINLVTTYSKDYSVMTLPDVKGINKITNLRDMPSLERYKHIAVLVGVHGKWSNKLSDNVDLFCQKYDAVVLRNHASNYSGKYGVDFAVINFLTHFENELSNADLVIYIGSVARYQSGMKKAEMWRVSPDGDISDSERKLTKVFQMEEADFFEYYVNNMDVDTGTRADSNEGYAHKWQKLYAEVMDKITELPFSNVWIAKNTIDKLPQNSVLHYAGANTARAWNYFELPKNVECYSNDGTMGIDGQVSALIGESLASPDRLHFGVVGDLTFFYDMNSLGNRHIGNNLRLMVINNGEGAEFKIYTNTAYQWGKEGDKYMSAAGHFGNKSTDLIKNYAESLGYEYITANNKENYQKEVKRFLNPKLTERPMVFEVFTESDKENEAVYIMNHLLQSANGKMKDAMKDTIKNIAGEKGLNTVKKILGKKK
jgi:2-succinyl-5-enolpyruvyl-6-hydroxy-3-cyclohexene-1-carboxylate synthase